MQSGVEPKALADKPVMYQWMTFYLKAFYTLSGCRSYGMAANPISFEALNCYIYLHEIDDFEDFIEIMVLMDMAYLKKYTEIQKRKSEKPKKAK